MVDELQLTSHFAELDAMQSLYGEKSLASVYGAGCIERPHICFIFMNPTGKNISASTQWRGIRAPWIGTKHVWKIFHALGVLPDDVLQTISNMKPQDWTPEFAENLYRILAQRKVYITNLAKCTQADAKPLSDRIFKQYLTQTLAELEAVKPQKVITFGNQVSSVLLGKSISVSLYEDHSSEVLQFGSQKFTVYPVYYPVGQGMRNLPAAIKRIKLISTA